MPTASLLDSLLWISLSSRGSLQSGGLDRRTFTALLRRWGPVAVRRRPRQSSLSSRSAAGSGFLQTGMLRGSAVLKTSSGGSRRIDASAGFRWKQEAADRILSFGVEEPLPV